MSRATERLKPELVWKYFEEVVRIPRCSGNEAAISQYVSATAKRLGLTADVDRVGNVRVRKPASPGREHDRSIALQGHLNMVGEKTRDTIHDLSKDPTGLVRQEDVIMANGATLGADKQKKLCRTISALPQLSFRMVIWAGGRISTPRF